MKKFFNRPMTQSPDDSLIRISLLTNVGAVFTKELRALTRSPLLYILGAVFLGLAGYFFYTDAEVRTHVLKGRVATSFHS